MSDLALDQILLTDPEPCEFCPTGIWYAKCYDDVHRCRTCIGILAEKLEWNDPPAPPEPKAEEVVEEAPQENKVSSEVPTPLFTT